MKNYDDIHQILLYKSTSVARSDLLITQHYQANHQYTDIKLDLISGNKLPKTILFHPMSMVILEQDDNFRVP